MSKTNKLQSKVVTPTEEEQVIIPDDGFGGLSEVVVEAIPYDYVIPNGTTQIASNGLVKISEYEYASVDVKPSLQDKTAILSKAGQVVKPDAGYYGLSKVDIPAIPNNYVVPTGDLSINTNGSKDVKDYASVTVNVQPTLQQKTVTPTDKQTVVEADSNYNGLLSVTVNAIPNEYIIPSGEITINKNGATDVSKFSSVVVDVKPMLQSKSITPSTSSQTIHPDVNYDGMSLINVAAIPAKYIVPEGVKNISANGISDVTAYSTVNVDIVPKLQSKEVTPNKETQTITADILHDGLSEVVVNPIPDGYLMPIGSSVIEKNGKANVAALASVMVDVKPELQSKTVTPAPYSQEIKADDKYDGLASVKVAPIPGKYIIPHGVTTIDSNGELDVSKLAKVIVDVQPALQSATVTPTKYKQTIKPDIEHYGMSEVVVDAIPAKYIATDDATASASNIVSGKTAYINGKKVTGELKVQHYYTGSTAPSNSFGEDGDIYLRIGS